MNSWKDKKIAIIGDVMLDTYLIGSVNRISPEAPIPILVESSRRHVPGGAANAAANVTALGGESSIFGFIGDDFQGRALMQKLKELGIKNKGLVIEENRETIHKTRVVSNKHQLLRIDRESIRPVSDSASKKIAKQIISSGKKDVFLISDYAKGTIGTIVMNAVKRASVEHNAKIIVDPKPSNRHLYNGVYLITPNKKETEEMTGIALISKENIDKAGYALMKELSCNVLLTLGEKGMVLFERDNNPVYFPAWTRDISDVSGAGDTVIATIALGLAAGISLQESAELANRAAGIKVGKSGTASVSHQELFRQ